MTTIRTALTTIAAALILSASAAEPAELLLEKAKQAAASEEKTVFLMFSTTGCSWCKVLKAYLEAEEIKPIFTRYFVPVQIMLGNDTNTNPDAGVLERKYGPAEGVPYHVFLSPDGKEIVDSKENGVGGNIGYPAAPNEIAWFLAMVKKAAPKITPDEVKVLEAKLKSFRKN